MAPLPGQLQKKAILGLLRKLAENSDKMAEAILGKSGGHLQVGLSEKL